MAKKSTSPGLWFVLDSDDPDLSALRKMQTALSTKLVFLGNHSTEHVLNHALVYAQQHGTMDQLVIDGHSNVMKASSLGFIEDFLEELEAFEEKHQIKIAKRIVFAGCRTFGFDHVPKDMTARADEAVNYLREYATRRQVELVGSTTLTGNNVLGHRFGRFVHFTTDGTIERDKKFDPCGPTNLLFFSSKESWVKRHAAADKNTLAKDSYPPRS